jgi:hypothetical protein
LDTRTCPDCGDTSPSGSKFCSKCGADLRRVPTTVSNEELLGAYEANEVSERRGRASFKPEKRRGSVYRAAKYLGFGLLGAVGVLFVIGIVASFLPSDSDDAEAVGTSLSAAPTVVRPYVPYVTASPEPTQMPTPTVSVPTEYELVIVDLIRRESTAYRKYLGYGDPSVETFSEQYILQWVGSVQALEHEVIGITHGWSNIVPPPEYEDFHEQYLLAVEQMVEAIRLAPGFATTDLALLDEISGGWIAALENAKKIRDAAILGLNSREFIRNAANNLTDLMAHDVARFGTPTPTPWPLWPTRTPVPTPTQLEGLVATATARAVEERRPAPTDIVRFATSCSMFRVYSSVFLADLSAQVTQAGQVRVLRLYRDKISNIKDSTDEISDLRLSGLKGAMGALYLILNEVVKGSDDNSMTVAVIKSLASVSLVCDRQGY